MIWALIFALAGLGLSVSLNVALAADSALHRRRANAARDEADALKIGDDGARRQVVANLRREAVSAARAGCENLPGKLLAIALEVEKGGSP